MGLRCWQAREADRARTDGSAAAVLAGREDGGVDGAAVLGGERGENCCEGRQGR